MIGMALKDRLGGEKPSGTPVRGGYGRRRCSTSPIP